VNEPASSHAKPDKLVGAWLIVICALVFAMVMVGGATRLTDSGLSITQWHFDKTITPPLTDERWSEEFALYQRTTEYQHQNHGMSLGEFQRIYWWEWAHRFLGMTIGFVFALPFLAFLFTGRLRGRLISVAILFALGGLQGRVGWWMVTSGLFSSLDVSPIRLAIHLGLAFVIMALAFWLALGAFGWPRAPSKLGAPRALLTTFLGVLFVQIIFGALLAGSDGGAAYADWPTIGGDWLPRSYAALEPFWRNVTENHAAQHFHHRTLGYIVAALAVTIGVFAFRRGAGAGRGVGLALGCLALVQAGLGIATVLNATPLGLSLIHQAGAAALWLCGFAALRGDNGKIIPLS
jgi:cytochrome c oxidase assembly protein subunit 15